MKTDRILGIIIYLLNHDNSTASYLAERFHVSIRTIQRDIISISAIGIPVYSTNGKYGGYSILPDYKIKNYDMRSEDHQMVLKALESLSTSYTNDVLNNLIEKYNAIIEKEGGQKIFWDFSVTKENQQVQKTNALLEAAIEERHFIIFDYRNADGDCSQQTVQPLAIHYKWYSWYLFAYSPLKEAYRTFKVARMHEVKQSEQTAEIEHDDIGLLMKTSENAYYKTCIRIEVQFDQKECSLMEEYFPDSIIEKITEKEYRIYLEVPEKERLWKALLLSFGNKIRIISPESYRNELIQTAQKFLSNYDIYMS